jgi:hypothetical protein
MEWFRKHSDTVAILSGVLGSFIWMNAQLNDLKKDLVSIEKDIVMIKTVMLMKNILPQELAVKEENAH